MRPRILHPRARAVLIVGALLLGSVLLLAEKTAAAVLTVPYVTNPVADADLDGNPATGDWSGAASTAIPLENGEPLSYGTATLYTKHNGTVAFFRIDGYVDVPWASATGNHFWLGWQMSPSGTAHHGTGTWDGAFFGLWNGVDYAPAATSPPRPVDTNGFSKPPVADGSQDLVGAMATAGAAVPYAFTAEWRRTMDTGDPSDIVFVPDGATALNFFVTTDSDGDGSEGGAVAHNVVTNANTLIFGRPAGAPPVIPAGALVCGPEGDPLADGHARPLEYHATYFDPNTKITLYMTCSEDPSTMHVAIATPWSGWASLLVQATDSDASAFNEVQVMHGDEGGALALDAYANESTALTRDVDASAVAAMGQMVGLKGASFVQGDRLLDDTEYQLLRSNPDLRQVAAQYRKNRRELALMWIDVLLKDLHALWLFRQFVIQRGGAPTKPGEDEEWVILRSFVVAVILLNLVKVSVFILGPFALSRMACGARRPVDAVSRAAASALARIPSTGWSDLERAWTNTTA